MGRITIKWREDFKFGFIGELGLKRSGGKGGEAPFTQAGGRQCRGRPGAPRRAAEAARKLAITRNIRNKEIAKILLAHSNFLAPTGARQGAQGRPRHRQPSV